MGCVASVPRVAETAHDTASTNKPRLTSEDAKAKGVQGEDEGKDLIKARAPAAGAVEESKQKSRSRKSRARRLSYVDHTEDGKPTEAKEGAAGEDSEEEEQGVDSAAVKRSKAARRRRLSYVVDETDPKLKTKLAAAQAKPQAGPSLAEAHAPQANLGATADPNGKQATAPPPMTGRIKLSTACISRAGREPGFKKQNQDNCFAFDKYVHEGQALFGAFDGHGPEGHTVSGYVKQQLPVLLASCLKAVNAAPASALKQCFLHVDRAMNATKIDCEFSGSTACVALLTGQQLNVAWVGDSRGVLGRVRPTGGFEAVTMTTDHKPTSKDEQARIVASSGRVERLVDEAGQPIGPFRVWLQYAWIPGLAMSRALGDALAHQVGVISEPEVFTTLLTPKDAFIVLASDGVWEFIDGQAAVDIVGNASTAEEGCRQLVDEAFQRWLVEEEGVVDDITAVVVKFGFNE